MVMEAGLLPPPPRRPLLTEATTAVSRFVPLSIVIVWPALNPSALMTGMTVTPALVLVDTVVAPGVPIVAMTAVSRFSPESMKIVWPTLNPVTLVTLILSEPTSEFIASVEVDCN